MRSKRILLPSLIVLSLIHAGIIFSESRPPSTDVFLFKDAGVNWATKWRFVVANLPHMAKDQEVIYAYYPPVFPFTFGLWSKIAGVGLKQSIAFDSFLRLLRTLLLVNLALRLSGGALQKLRLWQWGLLGAFVIT